MQDYDITTTKDIDIFVAVLSYTASSGQYAKRGYIMYFLFNFNKICVHTTTSDGGDFIFTIRL